MVELFAMEYMTALGMTMVLLFLDSRYSPRRTIGAVCGTMVLVMAAVAAIYQAAGLEITLRIYSLIAHLPSLLLLLALSRFRGWRLVFQLLSAILFCVLVQHGAHVLPAGGYSHLRAGIFPPATDPRDPPDRPAVPGNPVRH